MAGALSPAQAVAYVRELSADVRAVAVLPATAAMDPGAGPAAAAVADPPAFARAAADALPGLRAAAAGDELVVRAPDGQVVFAAWDARHAVVATAGPLSLLGPTALDVRAALLALGGETPPADPPPAPIQDPDSAFLREIDRLLGAD